MKQMASFTTSWFVLLSFSAVTLAAAPATNSIASWLDGKHVPRISPAQAETFAQQHQRRAEALLAAFQASNDRAFLHEAISKHPRDARVALAAACPAGNQNADDMQDQRRWLDSLKRTAPENALAYYLSARDHFKTGEPDTAEQEVLLGQEKSIGDYAADWLENTQAAYRSAGYSASQSKALARITFFMPHLGRLREVGDQLISRAKSYRQKDNAVVAEKMLRAAVKLGQQLDRTNSLTLLENLVGISIQQNALKSLDSNVSFGEGGEKVQVQLDRLAARRNTLRTTAQTFNKVLVTMSDEEIGQYFDQQKRMGEFAAQQQFLRRRGF